MPDRIEPVHWRLFASLALTLAAAATAIAQSGSTAKPSQDSQQPPTFRTEANFVRVDVYPTQAGKPVLDLRAEDFEVLEDGKPQSIQTFEHVVVSPAGPQSLRSEPNSIGAARQLAANPRNRVFVLFLDTNHVTVEGSWHAREPLIRLIDRVLGPDDLVGVMTPKMSAADMVLARKTEVMASGLRDIWPWGERYTLQRTELEESYAFCFPRPEQADVVAAMIARRRERMSLDSLNELVLYLRNIREERKAIVTVSEGWLLFRPDSKLTELRTDPLSGRTEPIPGPDPISVGPDGRITTRNTRNSSGGEKKSECYAARLYLSMIDNERYFRDIIDEANMGNATFYTVDPRGLPVFDTPIGPGPMVPVAVDARILRNRLSNLRTLADATDGIAVMNNNDLDVGLKRISDDLSSYYLLGYYSTNGKLDGRFHNIKVRVKRSGVDVRARKGYRAATLAEVRTAKAAAPAPAPDWLANVTNAISVLARIRPDSRLSLNLVPVPAANSRAVSTVWIAGELQAVSGTDPWTKGGTVDLDVKAGNSSATARVTLAPAERAFAIPVTLSSPVDSGSLQVRARLTGADPAADSLGGVLTVDVPDGMGQPLLFRRGPATGNRVVPAASFQFSRTERARLEFPVGADVKSGAGRLLDKVGKPLPIPVTVGERTDEQTGQRWLTADIILAPLAAGDYAVELLATTTTREQKVVTALRVVR
jgi:VWFA-related protein